MQQQKITKYTAHQRQKVGFFFTWITMSKNIYGARELIYQLFRRDFLNAYKKSFLGIGWVFVSPIIAIISWVLLNATGVLTPGEVSIRYPAYVLVGTSIWGLFMNFYASSAETLKVGEGFITQVNYPHEALLIKQVAQQLSNFSITFAINIIVLLAFGIVPSWHILIFPLLILPLFFIAAAIGLIISVVAVVAPDVSNATTIMLNLLFYFTPIVYATKTDSSFLSKLVEYNPLTYLVGGVRDLITTGEMAYPERFIGFAVVAFILFLFSARLFYVAEHRVIERMV